MATTVHGVAVLKWGTHTCAGYIVNESEVTTEGSEEFLDDEDGQFVTHFTNFGIKDSTSLVFVPLTGTNYPAIDAKITFNTVIRPVLSKSRVNSKRAVEIWRLNLSGAPGITY